MSMVSPETNTVIVFFPAPLSIHGGVGLSCYLTSGMRKRDELFLV